MRAERSLNGPGRPRRAIWAVCLVALAAASCATQDQAASPRVPREVEVPPYLKDTAGETARFTGRDWVAVQGYGFVTGLDGTGTTVVPPGVRQQILLMMRRHHVKDPDGLLASRDTAVVSVGGMVPPGAGEGEAFDLEVRAIPGTETTSLEGGFLLECDLTRVAVGRSGEMRSEPMALARGSIFVSPFGPAGNEGTGDPRVGRVLAGGRNLKPRAFRLVLLEPSMRVVDQVVRLVHARFPDAAKGTRDAGIDLVVPREYRQDKTHFLDVVGALYLREAPDARDGRVNLLVETLQKGEDMERVSLCLEAFGAGIAPRLRRLADSPREGVRFYVGRTLARLQDAQAVRILEPIALADNSEYQEAAVEALGYLQSGLGLGVLGRALSAKSARVRVAAWHASLRLSPKSTVTDVFPNKFVLSVVQTRADPFVYVARTMEPHLALFGDVRVRPPVLVESSRVMATATGGADRLTLITSRRGHDIRIETPLDLLTVIRSAASPVMQEGSTKVTGLDLEYSDLVGLIHEMARRKALTGPIVLQPLEYRGPGGPPTLRPITTEAGAGTGARDAPARPR